MIISDKSQQTSVTTLRWRLVALSLVALAVIYLLIRFFFPYWGGNSKGAIVCDAEYTRGNTFISQGAIFKNAETQSNEKAYRGNYSSKTDRTQSKGMEYTLRVPKEGDRYKVSVYRYRTGTTGGEIVIKSGKGGNFEKREALSSSKNSDGWELMELTFNVPDNSNSSIAIYVYSNSSTPVYFDDLKIEKVSAVKSDLNIPPFQPKQFKLEIAEQFMKQIINKREEALNAGILINSDDDWVNAKINDGTQKLNADIRLKGNRLYHLQGSKWSYKIRVDDPYAWQQMQSLSLQNPASHSFLREWIYHQLLRKEGVIAARYDFIELKLNNKTRGIYAYQESPDLALAAFHQRPIAPVVRFSEDAFRYNEKRQIEELGQLNINANEQNQLVNAFDAALIEPYKSNRIAASDTLRSYFGLAQTLMHQYKYNLKPANQIFNVDLMARYFAIMDVMQAYQSLDWYDQRYYVNPVTSLLEPVGMSGFGVEVKPYKKRPYIGYHLFNTDAPDDNIYMHLFTDADFIRKYCQYLYQFTEKDYIDNFLLDIETEALRRQQFIRKEFGNYSYDRTAIVKNAKNIRASLIPENNISLVAKVSGFSSGKRRVKIANFHGLPLEVIGFGITKEAMTDSLAQPILLNTNLEGLPPRYLNFAVANNANVVFYKLPNVDKVFFSDFVFWDIPEPSVPAQALFEDVNLQSNSTYEVRGSSVIFKKGKYNISRNVIIPTGYVVNIPSGTDITFTSGALFLSKSPVNSYGKPDQPVILRGVNGMLISDARSVSTFRNTWFVNSDNLDINNWWLPGGLTVYNSAIVLDHCTFSYSKAPESLTLMRSNFEIIGCNFNKNTQKGLSAQFSNGKILKSRFITNALIGIELTGSRVELDEVTIHQASSRGLSVGEGSKVEVRYIEIKDTDIGVVSVDMSRLTIEKIDLQDCQRGFAAYQKKPEFGGSQIVVQDYIATRVKVLHRIEPGSTLKLKGEEVQGY